MEVNAIQCPQCGDVIFSRARYDHRSCSCSSVSIDGGLDYVKISCYTEKISNLVSFKYEIKQTEEELFEDWSLEKNLYGLIGLINK